MAGTDKPLPLSEAAERLRGTPGRPRKVLAPEAPPLVQQIRRLFDLQATATYLGVSGWTVRDLESAEILRRVRIPLPDGSEVRKLLFDRVDLDALVERWKA